MSAAAQTRRMAAGWEVPDPAEMPDYGRVTRLRGRIVLDFSPDLRGTDRYLWSLSGTAFESEREAERIRGLICADARHVPLEDAVARFRGQRSKTHRATDIIDRYLKAAPRLVSDRTDRPLSPRTIDAYRAVLGRARPWFEGLTIQQATEARRLRDWKAWFQIPAEDGGRGLTSDHEARNAFAAFRAVIAWYKTTRPNFPEPDWPSMPTAITAKRRNRSRRESEARLSLPEVVKAIDALPPERQPIFWVMFYTGARPTEARGVLGWDWDRPRLRVCRSAENRSGGCRVRDTTKTGETGSYELPEWLCDLIDRHRVSIDRDAPLFQNPDPQAPSGVISDDALRDAWETASTTAGLPWVPPYRAMKHTQVSALRDAGIPIEDIVAQYRWSGTAMLEHYDEAKDERRGGVVARLDDLVGRARKG